MITVNICDAKTHLSRLVEDAAKGNSFIIAKNGKPMVKVVSFDGAATLPATRLGFMAGQIAVPDDFDTMARTDIASFFGDA